MLVMYRMYILSDDDTPEDMHRISIWPRATMVKSGFVFLFNDQEKQLLESHKFIDWNLAQMFRNELGVDSKTALLASLVNP